MTTKVKICGLSTSDTMAAALEAGADYVGLVFFPPSPRNISLATAKNLAALARGKARIVALFVDPDDELLGDVMRQVAPDMIQLHGSETPKRVAEISQLTDRPVMKAIKVETASDARAALDYADICELILFDAKAPAVAQDISGTTLPGGNGIAFDWSALEDIKDKVPFMLSGGLDPQNVATAITATGALSVDVSSGVETAPGVKDIDMIEAFVKEAKDAYSGR